ncbi:hypothetical protein [Vibrio owensii]|uniref:hypothetical protein n=1 Tax=Vibrio harveyi group TaxID=717610 RepID=UPI003CC63EA2
MLSDRIERINELRKKAMQDPTFLKSASAHENAIKIRNAPTPKKTRPKKRRSPKKPKKTASEPLQMDLLSGDSNLSSQN